MNYKSIIKSRSLRLRILRFLSFVPDRLMINIQYKIKTGRKLNLKNPKRFSEKLQWYKLYYKNPIMIQCVDKYEVRSFVENKGLGSILIPILGIYNSSTEINWDLLPNQFVLKDTLGGGGASVIIVKDKKTMDVNEVIKQADSWIGINSRKKDGGREWPYYSGKGHRIIIEKFIEADTNDGNLVDYKFFCFYGKPEYIYVIADREIGNGAALGIFDSEFNRLNAFRNDERKLEKIITKPSQFEEMKRIASILSSDFPEARIDLYEVKGKILFGEITFYDGSGYMTFSPDEFDYVLGEHFNLEEFKR